MNGSKPFNVYRNGQRYGSWYEVKDGEVEVFGAYGSAKAAKGREDPENVAERLLGEILEARSAA